MKLVTLTLLIGAALLLASACSKPETVTTNQSQPTLAATPLDKASATPDAIAVARATFQKDCAGCHGEDGKGGSKTIDGKTLRVPSLTEGHALKHSDKEFSDQIVKGGDGMPAFMEKLWPEQIDGLVRYIRKEFQGK